MTHRKEEDAIDYEVGFGKPPAHTRFKKGQSGNAKGRPKGAAGLAASLEKAMHERVAITENGRRKTISKLDAAVKQVVNKAAGGDMRAFALMAGLAQVVSGKPEAALDHAASDQMDQKILKQFIDRVRDAGSDATTPNDDDAQ